MRPPSSPSVPADDDDDDTDDDIFILENTSTPKPPKPGLDLNKIKTEPEQSDVCMPLERSDDAALDVALENNVAGTDSAGLAAVETSPSPATRTEVASATTQTEVPKVKKEEEDLNQTKGEDTTGQRGRKHSRDVDINFSFEHRVIKQESSGDTHSENQGKQTLQKGVTHPLDSEDDAGPSFANSSNRPDSPLHYPSMIEVQEQQDQLLELMQATAQERDSFKEQVHTLTCQLQEAKNRLQEPSQINVKKECSHQASQTEETEGGKDYKSLFEKAKQKVDELIKDKKALLATTETKPSAVQGEEDSDDIAQQVDCLVRELDQRNKERDELHSQVSVVF